jgi:DNA-binding transcriptional ArsR family regulator
MTLLRLSPAGISRCRFAISPLAETLGALIALHRDAATPWQPPRRDDADDVQRAYRDWLGTDQVATGLMALVAATKFLPDAITPPPRGGMGTTIAEELAEVAAVPDDAVRANVATAVAASWQPQQTGWLASSGLAGRTADVLEQGWHRFVAPDWARRRAVLERDVMHRAGILAAYGWQQAVAGMTRHARWIGDDAIQFDDKDWPDRHISDDGLVFVPYTAGGGWWTCERPDRHALVYPAWGPASPIGRRSADALAGLLGPGRAKVFRELGRPATSSQLALSLGLSLGTVSAHLAVLRETGMIAGHRTGRHVIYQLAAQGESLIQLLGEGDQPDGPSAHENET